MRLSGLYLLAVLLFTSVGEAREEFGYFGAGGGVTFLEDTDDAFDNIDEKSTTIKAYIGYRASTYLAFELEYAYMGEYDYTQGALEDTAEFSTLAASIVVMYPLVWDNFELYTPIGISGISTDYGDNNEYNDKIIPGYRLGFGVAYTPTKHFTLRVGGDVTVFEIEGANDDLKQNLASAYATLQYNF